MCIRILITDDHGVIRAGLRVLLNTEPDIEVVGEAADGITALELGNKLQPDLVLLDVGLPDLNGIRVTQKLKALLPDARVLILTVHEDEGLLREALEAGASGYIVKRAVETELLVAIRAVCRGELYIHSALTRQLLDDLSPRPMTSVDRLESLTPRETDVFRLLVKGYTNRQAAAELCISPRTVEGHRANLMGKLELHNRAELVSFAEQHGLLD